MDEVPYFLWSEGEKLKESELRAMLCSPHPEVRGLWMGRIMREANYTQVWQYLTLAEVVRDWPFLEKYLGRSRKFWNFVFEGWRRFMLIPADAAITATYSPMTPPTAVQPAGD